MTDPGQAPRPTIAHGVGFVIRNEILNYIRSVTPVSERLSFVTFRGTFPLTFASCYAPTAEAPENVKDLFYTSLTNEIRSRFFKGP
eukprot:7167415-Prorocentrum_lima.AAC.1